MASTQDDLLQKLRKIALASAASITASKMPERPQQPLSAAVSEQLLRYPQPAHSGESMPPAKRMDLKEWPRPLISDIEKDMAAASLDAVDGQVTRHDLSAPILSSVQVPGEAVGTIIGKKGECIKRIEKHYGVLIQVTNESAVPGMKTICLVGGTEDAQAKVTEEVLKIAEKKKATVQCDQFCGTIEVPQRFCGMVVGSKGEFIKEVQALTNTQLQLSQERSGPLGDQKTITITGFSQDTINQAHRAIEMRLLEAYRRDGIYNAPLETKFALPPPPAVEPPATSAVPAVGITPSDVLAGMKEPEALGFGPFVGSPPNQLGLTGAGVHGQPPQRQAGKPMEGDMSGQGRADGECHEAIMQWAAFYAREPTCVSYYMSLRSQAAQAFAGASGAGA